MPSKPDVGLATEPTVVPAERSSDGASESAPGSRPSSRSLALALGILAAFLWSVWSYLPIPPPTDNAGILWLVRNVRWWSFATDPLSAGYSHMFIFDPGLPLLHYLIDWLLPSIGMASFHLPGIAGSLVGSLLLAALVWSATDDELLAAAAATLYLLSIPVWYNIATSFNINYSWATAFSLASILPAWRSYHRARVTSWTATVLSAALYGCGLVFKPSIAALPLVILVLEYGARRTWLGALARMTPYAITLSLMIAWNVHLFGGLGGYLNTPQMSGANLLLALPVLLYGTWGLAAPMVVLLLLPFRHRRWLALVAAVGFAASAAPFLMADPIRFDEAPLWAGRLELGWALLIACTCSTLANLRQRRLQWALLALLLAVQLACRLDSTAMAAMASSAAMEESVPTSQPIAVIHHDCFAPYVRSLLAGRDHPPLRSYCNEVIWWLDQALGHPLPPGAVKIGFPPPTGESAPKWPAGFPSLQPLPLEGITLSADERGRVQLKIPESLTNQLILAVVYENGPSQVITAYAIGRTTAEFPLNYSVRELWLFRIPQGNAIVTEPWPIYVWPSPFFVNPYPPDGEGNARGMNPTSGSSRG